MRRRPNTSSDWTLSRRQFLMVGGTAGLAALTGGALWGYESQSPAAPTVATGTGSSTSGPLVVVTLYGGNDGLNTVIPYGDPAYRAARPTLGYDQAQVLDIGDGFGLNPQLKGLQSLWKSGQLAVVRGVGYPNPNLSHFASMDIWQTANPVDGSGAGWLGRWLDATGHDPMRAISVGTTLPPMLRGQTQAASSVTASRIKLPGDPELQRAFTALAAAGADRSVLAQSVANSGTDLLDVKSQLDALTSASGPAVTAPSSSRDLDAQLTIVADLIKAGAPTKVYQVSLASFDTHADEKAGQEKLLGELDAAVTKFVADVSATAAGRNTVLMAYSEFGRRPAENASGGTDHGTAAPVLVVGRPVRGGQFYGDEPSLTALDPNGNLVHSVDFRSVYATMLEKVLAFDSKDVLGGSFPTLPFL